MPRRCQRTTSSRLAVSMKISRDMRSHAPQNEPYRLVQVAHPRCLGCRRRLQLATSNEEDRFASRGLGREDISVGIADEIGPGEVEPELLGRLDDQTRPGLSTVTIHLQAGK